VISRPWHFQWNCLSSTKLSIFHDKHIFPWNPVIFWEFVPIWFYLRRFCRLRWSETVLSPTCLLTAAVSCTYMLSVHHHVTLSAANVVDFHFNILVVCCCRKCVMKNPKTLRAVTVWLSVSNEYFDADCWKLFILTGTSFWIKLQKESNWKYTLKSHRTEFHY